MRGADSKGRRMSHYCKICGCDKPNESFSGKGQAAHICKKCAKLPKEVRDEKITLNRIYELPWRLSKGQLQWLEKLKQGTSDSIREVAVAEWNRRYALKERSQSLEDEDDGWIPNTEYD